MQIADLYVYSTMHVIMDIKKKQDLYRNLKRIGIRMHISFMRRRDLAARTGSQSTGVGSRVFLGPFITEKEWA